MAEIQTIRLKCTHCGKEIQCKMPEKPGKYAISCTNPNCKNKIVFNVPLITKDQNEPKEDIKFGLLEDGSYRFRCNNQSCLQSVLVPAKSVKIGHNTIQCPKCKTTNEFEIIPTEKDLLKCQAIDCDGILDKPCSEDGLYSVTCKCGRKYSLLIENGKVVKAIMKTPTPLPPTKQWKMKLVSGCLFNKKEYTLTKGMHYVGRIDDELDSDFSINDKYASKRSIRIDVNENGGNLVYRLTVERATNPVYHNNRELTAGDIVYLTYGDTLKLGKTLIKVQKIEK